MGPDIAGVCVTESLLTSHIRKARPATCDRRPSTMTSGMLLNKIVVVTGASTGIGRAIAIGERPDLQRGGFANATFCAEAARQGGNIVVHYLGANEVADAEEVGRKVTGLGRKVVLVPGDISDPETAKKVRCHANTMRTRARLPYLPRQITESAVSAFGRIDVLVSNAGICPFHSFLDMPDALWKRVQAVNLDGSFYITRAVANQMAAQSPQGGSIVAVSSISALMGGGKQTHYTPTKAGIKSLMESCAIALGPMGIRCNSVLPGERIATHRPSCALFRRMTRQARSRPTSTRWILRIRPSGQTCPSGVRRGARLTVDRELMVTPLQYLLGAWVSQKT